MAMATVSTALTRIGAEVGGILDALSADNADQLDGAAELIDGARRVFVHGAGRSGLALRMTAMRLMHLGRAAYVVGETVTPAIGRDDVLLAASGSGTTPTVLRAAETARDAGADVVAITTSPESPLARLARVSIVIPAATKTDRSRQHSQQYAGSLFEQVVVLVGDAIFHTLWQRSGSSADELWPRHANLE